MNSETLNQHLFSARTRVYAVIDGAAVPDLRMKLYEMKPVNFCLMPGDLEPDMAEVAPYLVKLDPKTPFTDWFLKESPGKHWGIFAHSRSAVAEIRKHFRALLTVYDEKGNPMLFRFYDPRVLPQFLQTCNGAELKTFFGKVDNFFAENDKGLLNFSLAESGLKQKELD